MSIVPAIALALAPFAPPDSDIHALAEEAKRVAADEALNRMKSNGTLHQLNDTRALSEQLKWSST